MVPKHALEEALDRIEDGEGPGNALALVQGIADPVARRAWTDAVRAAAAVGHDPVAPVDPEAWRPARFADAPGELRVAALRTCACLERAATIALDRASLAALVPIHATLAGDDPGPRAAAMLARCWLGYFDGERSIAEEAADLRAAASRQRLPELVVEATALEALAKMAAGESAAALASARRAALMARSEGRRSRLWLADLVLARGRRYAGRPYLGGRIAATLATLAPPVWQGWIALECALAGVPAPAAPPAGAGARAAAAIDALLAAAMAGHRADFERHAALALTEVSAVEPVRRELEDLLGTLDLSRAASAEVEAWRRGELPRPPRGLQGVCARASTAGLPPNVYAGVLAGGAERGGRVLGAGLALLVANQSAALLPDPSHDRALAAISALALAGPSGLGRDELFRRVYAFGFVPRLHTSLFDLLVHRARKLLGSRGEVAREGEQMTLRVRAPLVMPDPRCVIDTEERLLAVLAAGPIGTDDAAAAIGVPSRTVRAALRRLVEDGACREQRDGRHVLYRIDDTTFTEPTPSGT